MGDVEVGDRVIHLNSLAERFTEVHPVGVVAVLATAMHGTTYCTVWLTVGSQSFRLEPLVEYADAMWLRERLGEALAGMVQILKDEEEKTDGKENQ